MLTGGEGYHFDGRSSPRCAFGTVNATEKNATTMAQYGTLFEPADSYDDIVAAFRPPGWMKQGACVGKDPKLWSGKACANAVAICRACPVRVDCLAYAIHENITEGTWGGMSARQRLRYLRSLGRRLTMRDDRHHGFRG